MFDAAGRIRTAWCVRLAAASSIALAWGATAPATAQVAGPNVNMVSGTQWPGGDPFLQRQNEPSVAVSTRNPAHLLAGANDYRTVDLPGLPVGETGDAWLGLFKSFDGGQTWQSTLVPGYPQDQSAAGLASPLKGFGAAADPVVRAGTDGLFYYSGITFNRGSNQGQVFVSRFLDLNNKENGDATQSKDPIQYLGATVVDTGTSGQFLDKPWLAVDIPRAGAATCTLPVSPTQSVQAGTVYLAYAKFTSNSGNLSSSNSQVLVSRSLDCGVTWSKPIKISSGNHLNQGTTVAIDPATGAVYVAYRRFADSSQPDAIVVSKSTDFGQTFNSGVDAALVTPFDQATTPTEFRTTTLPALGVSVDSGGTSRVHIAWAQRAAALADARIVVLTSRDAVSWPPTSTAVDSASIGDDFSNTFGPGHQFMPSLTFTGGKLMVLYYDQRLDHTLGHFFPNQDNTQYPDFGPDPVTGSFYREKRVPIGELQLNPSLVFTPTIDEANLTQIRHLIDLRVAQADPSDAPVFTSSRVSRYKFGADSTATTPYEDLDQLEVNPPNLPMFKQGTLPFIGDYVEIAGLSFTPKPGGGWQFNTAAQAAPVHYAVWTSNQDVVPPPDGDWTRYTPLGNGGTSLYDPTQQRPACLTGYEGTRNQNVYSSRITQGLLAYSPQNAKPLNVQRAFVVIVQNTTLLKKAFRLTALPDNGVYASFQNAAGGVDQLLSSIDVSVPPASSIARSVFVHLTSSTNPAAGATVSVAEVIDDGTCLTIPGTCVPVPGGLSASLGLNPPGSFAPGSLALVQPDGSSDPVASSEVYVPTISSASVTSPNLASVTSASVTSASVTSASVTSASVTSSHIAVPQLASVTSASVTSASVTSYNLSNASVTSAPLTASVTSGNIFASVTSASVTSASISDANYSVTNTGNTTHSYHVKLVGRAPANTPIQLILSKPYSTPFAQNCQLVQDYRPVTVVNVDDVSSAVLTDPSQIPNPDVPDPLATNATITLAPGESGVITVRGALDIAGMQQLATQIAPAVVPHAGGSYAAVLLVTSDGSTLPAIKVGVPYSAALQAAGGSGPYSWTLVSGSLPAGLVLGPDGTLSGTPLAPGTTTGTVQVTDSKGGTATKSIQFTAVAGPSATSLAASPASPAYGSPIALTATVSAASPGPSVPAPTGAVTLSDGATSLGSPTLAGSNGTASATFTVPALSFGAGTHNLGAAYAGDGNYGASSGSLALTVLKATPVVLVSGGTYAYDGQPHPATATYSGIGGSTPIGTLVVTYNGSTTAPTNAGTYAVLATFTSSDPNYTNATGSATITISGAAPKVVVSGGPFVYDGTVHAATATVTGIGGVTVAGSFTFSYGGAGTSPVNAGTYTVTASFTSSDPNYGNATGTGSIVVNPATPTVVVSGGTFTYDGNPHPATAIATGVGGAAVSGTFAFTYNGSPAPPTNAGAYPVVALFSSANPNYTNASGAGTIVINKASSTTSLAASPTTVWLNQSVTLTATVAAVAPGAGSPTGTVTFKDGATVIGTATLVAGTATLSTSTLASGSHSITASYGGDGNFVASVSASQTVTVNPPYTFIGFQTPLTTAGTLAAPTYSGTWSYSRTLPIKWQLLDSSGKNVTSLSTTKLLSAWYAGATCPGTSPVGSSLPNSFALYSPTQGAAGGSTFRSGSTGFIFNWDATKVPTGPGCYWIRLQLVDGSPEKVTTVLLN